MRILVCRTGDCMRRMRNLCEMYAKCMRSQQDKCSNGFYGMIGAFSEVSSFANFLYAKYAKPIFSIYASTLPTILSFRIFAYIFNINFKGLFRDLECSRMCFYAKISNFAYFRILRINQVK